MEKLRILQINSGVGWSGSHHQVYLLSRGLADRGHEVTIVCEPQSYLMERALAAGLRTAPLRMRGQWDLKAVLKLRRLIKELQIEIINTHKPLPHTLAVLAAGWSGPLVVATRRVSFPLKRHPFMKWKWDWAVAALIAVSKGAAATLIASGISPKKVVTIYSAVDLTRFHPDVSGEAIRKEFGISPDTLVVGQVADLRPYKGYGVLIEAAALVLKQMPDVHFFFIGRKNVEVYDELARRIDRLGIAQKVSFTGFRKDVEAFYATMAICVNSTTMAEGLPGSLREAMAMGVPVIGSKVKGNLELVIPDRTGVLVPPRDPQALAEAILDLLNDPARRSKMGLEGSRWMEADFSVQTMVNRTEALYLKLIENANSLA
ncbi:MAG TPA: glycosyltransferase [Nitrospiria bacterium]|nr:glycosyltransferase [Nitrospiria bacterium]